MKKIKLFAMLLSLACAAVFSACDSDDEIKSPLNSPTVTQEAASYRSLSFSWNKIENAVQYGYRLIDPNGIAVKAGVINDTSITLSGLQPATTYTLEVWAFSGMDSDYSTPPAVTLTATTDGLTPLQAPTVTIAEGDYLIASWEAVPGAKEYSYTISNGEALVTSDVTTSTSIKKVLPAGNYTVSVIALGHDQYSNSPAGSATATLNVTELYTVTGLYYSAVLDKSWEAKLVAYSNGSYSILNYYGVTNYNLEFVVDAANKNDKFSFLNGEEVYDEVVGYRTWQVPTGSWLYPTLIAYPWSNYCSFEGDSESGEVRIGNYYGDSYAYWGEDTFVWPVPAGDNPDPMAAITGTYNNHFIGTSSINDDWSWEDIDAPDWKATIKKIEDDIVEIDGLFWTQTPVYGIVDFEAGTITIEAQDYGDTYYTFASSESATESVIATINGDGSITVPDFGLWYYFDGDGWYYYLYGTATLTK